MREIKPHTPLHFILIGIVVLYAGLLLIAPLLAIVDGAFKEGIQPILTALSTPDAVSALKISFSLAIAASIINTIAGIIIAWVLVRHHFPGKHLFNALVDLPFVASPVIIGFVIIVLFGRGGWLAGLNLPVAFAWPGMLLVTVFVSLPFVIREVMPVLEALTPEQEEAAFTLGASKIYTFRRVIMPGIWHGVLYGVVLTLARSLGEFGGVSAAGGGIQMITETSTIYIYRSISDRNEVGAYSMSVVLGLISITILLIMSLVKRAREVPTAPVVSGGE
jgi:sulfate/thiosulfate transport system permease protein